MTISLTKCARTLAVLAVVGLLTGCSVSRKQELQRLSNRVEKDLKAEREAVLDRPSTDPERGTRLGHLTNLKTTHALADVGLSSASRVLQGNDLELAYDVLEEVYGVIDWNIPLLPSESKPLPTMFGPSGLDFTSLQAGTAGQPVTPSGYAE